MNTTTVANIINMSFRFKQFFVNDDRCAMKVGTDGVLLGAWTPIINHQSPITNHQSPIRVLDIGTGSGLVALMVAQRAPEAQIDAIDIDEPAVTQAAENFAASPWSDRLHAYHSALQDWQGQSVPSLEGRVRERFYDLIVSNPPYFRNSLKNPDEARKTARHTDTLSFEDLLLHSKRLLKPQGGLALILPAEAEKEALLLAGNEGLQLTLLTRVFSKDTKPARRILIAFSLQSPVTNHQSPVTNSQSLITPYLVLEDAHGARSAAYRELTKDFYL